MTCDRTKKIEKLRQQMRDKGYPLYAPIATGAVVRGLTAELVGGVDLSFFPLRAGRASV